jgi:hypothetical protein
MGCLLRRFGALLLSAFVFTLLVPIVGPPFSVLMHPDGLLTFVLTPLTGAFVVFGLLQGFVAGATFGLFAATLPIRVVAQILSPPRWLVRARFASAGFMAGAVACATIAHGTYPIHHSGRFIEFFSFLASFGLPAGAICGLVVLPILRGLAGGRFGPDNNRESLLDLVRLRDRLPPGTGNY